MVRIAVSGLHDGPPELAAQLPVSGTLTRRLPDPNGWQVWIAELDRPVRFHIPLDAHTDNESLTVQFDEHGPFLWVRAVAVAAGSGESWRGARQLLVHLAYVLNPDEVEDVSGPYIGSVGEVYIDDITATDDEPEQAVAETTSPRPGSAETAEMTSDVAPLSYDEVDADLEWWVSKLAEVAAAAPATIPDLIYDAAQAPGYVLEASGATYYGLDGTSPRTTDNRHELVYWIVEDLAAGLAYGWALTAPAHQEGDSSATRALWLGRWHNLMAALATTWGERTRERIETSYIDPT